MVGVLQMVPEFEEVVPNSFSMFFLVLQMVPDFLEVVSGFNRHPSTNRLTQVPIYIYIVNNNPSCH